MDVENKVLDLCVRKRPTTPDYYTNLTPTTKFYVDSSSSCQYSPVSNHSDSETSSTISDKTTGTTTPTTLTLALPSSTTTTTTTKIKTTRPFKAYLKDPLNLALGVVTTPTTVFGRDSMDAFAEFRKRALEQVHSNNNNTNGTINKNMRRIHQNQQNRNEDPNYWEKRRKNNEAAKRSRDARRAKEDEIAIRCAFLEQENLQLKFRIATLENERQRLQDLVYHHT